MPYTARQLLIFWLLQSLVIVKQVFSIDGPTYIRGYIGKDALFMWNTTDQREILSVSWGISHGNLANPQYINVNGYTGKVNMNIDLDENLRKRVGFVGDLKKGFAWFVLKNLTVNDTNEYIASISDNVTSVQSYYVQLDVIDEKEVMPTKGPPDTTRTPGMGYNRTTAIPNITSTTAPEPSSTIKAQHINNPLIGYCTGYVLIWHVFVKRQP